MASVTLALAAFLTVFSQARWPTRALVLERDWLISTARPGKLWNNEAATARFGQPVIKLASTPGSRMRLYFDYPSIGMTVEVDFDTMTVVGVD